MEIELKEIPIRELFDGYLNNNEDGVVGYGGLLDIRPAYQREFVYKDRQQEAVIETIRKNFPLNVMYWVKNGEANYELLDGQQRTISICEYLNGKFSLNFQYFHNLEQEEKDQILDYKLMVYFCEGNSREKLDWFKTINIAGEKLTPQELRNAVYTGSWLSDAKRYFSKTNCPAWNIGKDYLSGSPIRQDYLETALEWVSDGNPGDYMAANQNSINASELWIYFQNVINWTKFVFPNYRRELKGLPLGDLYNRYSAIPQNGIALEIEIQKLMQDDEVTKKSGVYLYVLSGNEKYLNLRAFSSSQKREVFEVQNGICKICGEAFTIDEMEADHIVPWSGGGKTNIENCQMLCKSCNRTKSNN